LSVFNVNINLLLICHYRSILPAKMRWSINPIWRIIMSILHEREMINTLIFTTEIWNAVYNENDRKNKNVILDKKDKYITGVCRYWIFINIVLWKNAYNFICVSEWNGYEMRIPIHCILYRFITRRNIIFLYRHFVLIRR